MERFIQFNDEKIDSFLYMQLTDLAKTLSKMKEMEVEFGPFSYLDRGQQKVFVSYFWDHRPAFDKVNGLKSDVYLRAIGSLHYTDYEQVRKYVREVKKTSISSFAKQLFVLAEDLRLEDICTRLRPGTKRSFAVRRKLYKQHFRTQMNANLVKSVLTDALFCKIYLMLNAESPLEAAGSLGEKLDSVFPFIEQTLLPILDANSTSDVSRCCLQVVEVLDELLEKDMLNEYFHLPETVFQLEDELSWKDLKRMDPLECHNRTEKKNDDEDLMEEQFQTWHRETKDKGKSFLQFDLDQGSKSDLLGDGVREGDVEDQALGIVQGSSQKSSRHDFSSLEAEQMRDTKKQTGKAEYGKENRFAYPVFKRAAIPRQEEILHYQQLKSSIAPLKKKLKKLITEILERKNSHPRNHLHFGRLDKNLLRYFLEEQPRLFYKKHQPSWEIDAAFALLVDCSASMEDKMNETKVGITLFHEALKSVKVPHEIAGFWEDANEATQKRQPNYLKTVIDYSSSLNPASGPEILQLNAKEDNRDGFAIRIMTERILRRSEKQKFLLVFSDGEPAALNYAQNGIIDTHEAVVEARKQGIEVINVFLSKGGIEEGQKKTIENIYGKYTVLVSNVEELPDFLFPLLRKLLIQSI
ncbi:hypothetical protein [Bacillus smithii]|uniref:vWA domain-containing protein n=1 Tax=Bacillus smithii TaxID=1479 RepID=UPI0030C8E41D